MPTISVEKYNLLQLLGKEYTIEELIPLLDYVKGELKEYKYKHLLVAPFNMRKKLVKMINNEIKMAKKGGRAEIILKINSLQDQKMIEKLYEASNAGVKIRIIVRGICCLIPGVKGLSENIEIISFFNDIVTNSFFNLC